MPAYLSLPKKLNPIVGPSSSLPSVMCSTRKLQQPTVSASSEVSFSLPARIAVCIY